MLFETGISVQCLDASNRPLVLPLSFRLLGPFGKKEKKKKKRVKSFWSLSYAVVASTTPSAAIRKWPFTGLRETSDTDNCIQARRIPSSARRFTPGRRIRMDCCYHLAALSARPRTASSQSSHPSSFHVQLILHLESCLVRCLVYNENLIAVLHAQSATSHPRLLTLAKRL